MKKIRYTLLFCLLTITAFAQEHHEIVGVTKAYNGEPLTYLRPAVFNEIQINDKITIGQLRKLISTDEVIPRLGEPLDVKHIKNMSADGKHVVMEDKILRYPGLLLYYSVRKAVDELVRIELTTNNSYLTMVSGEMKVGARVLDDFLPTGLKASKQDGITLYVAVSRDDGEGLMKNKKGNVMVANDARIRIEKDSSDKIAIYF